MNLDFTLSEFSPWVSDAIRTRFSLQFLPVVGRPLALLAPFSMSFMYCCFGAKTLFRVFWALEIYFIITFMFLIIIILSNNTLLELIYYVVLYLSN